MKRLHLHIRVDDLAASTRFYETLLGVAPDVAKPDYAQWNLDDPSVNLAISTFGEHREAKGGIDHVGIQVEDEADLADVTARLKAAEQAVFEEKGNPCCYAVGAKSWSGDPQGVIWETFARLGTADTMGPDAARDASIDALRAEAAAPESAGFDGMVESGRAENGRGCCG